MGCLSVKENVSFNYKSLLNSVFLQPLCIIQYNFNFFQNNVLILSILLILIINLVFFFIKNDNNFGKVYFIIFIQCLIYGCIHGVSPQRATSVIFIMMFFNYIKEYKSKTILYEISIVIILVISVSNGFIAGYLDLKNNYSSAEETAKYINSHIENSTLLVGNLYEYYTPLKFYLTKQDIKFINSIEINDINELKEKFGKKNLYYLVVYDNDLNSNELNLIYENQCQNKMEIVFKSQKSIIGEQYIIYKINDK